MIRLSTSLLLASILCSPAFSDDPPIPGGSGPSLGLSPVPDSSAPVQNYGQSSGAYSYERSIPAPTSGPVYSSEMPQSYSSPPVDTQPYNSGSTVISSGPVVSSPLPVLSSPATGCNCNGGGASYSVSSFGVPSALPSFAGGFSGYDAMGYNGGGMETYTGAVGGGLHARHPYYSYRRPWYANGPVSNNVTIAW